jgi:hypothetical protein
MLLLSFGTATNSTHLMLIMKKYPVTSLNIKFLSPALIPFQIISCSTGASVLTRQHRGRPRNPGSIPDTAKTVTFSKVSRPALGTTQPPVQWTPKIGPSHVPRRGRNHSHASIAEAKNKWYYLPIPHMTTWRVPNKSHCYLELYFGVSLRVKATYARNPPTSF